MHTLTTQTGAGQAQRRPAADLAAAAAAGVVLGTLDLFAQRVVPYPWAAFANSAAIWAIAVFALGCWVRGSSWRPVVSGVLMLTVAVESYYLASVSVQHDSTANLASRTTVMWLVFGVVGGAVFGLAGGWSRAETDLRASAGTALAASVLYAEALVRLSANSAAGHDRLLVAVSEAALAFALLLITGRTNRRRALGFTLCLPLAAVGFLAFSAAGFGG